MLTDLLFLLACTGIDCKNGGHCVYDVKTDSSKCNCTHAVMQKPHKNWWSHTGDRCETRGNEMFGILMSTRKASSFNLLYIDKLQIMKLNHCIFQPAAMTVYKIRMRSTLTVRDHVLLFAVSKIIWS